MLLLRSSPIRGGQAPSAPNRATEGFMRSLFGLLKIDLPVPDHTTLSRRGKMLPICLPRRASGRLADDFAPGGHAWVCPTSGPLLAAAGNHAGVLCDSDPVGENLVCPQVW